MPDIPEANQRRTTTSGRSAQVPETPQPWPEPYYQPDRTQDCGFYTAAYIARCLGYSNVTAEAVKQWRAQTTTHEDFYVHRVYGVPLIRWWDYQGDEIERQKFWLGPDQRQWFTERLRGHIAHVEVFRIPTMGHAVVALEARDEGVLLMDPIYGHVVEPWDWFLSIGAGNHGCHYVAAFYPLPNATTEGVA
jgi:hypothetical protein